MPGVKPPIRGAALVFLVTLAATVWSTFGPFLVSPGPYHWSVNLPSAWLTFAFGVLWVPITAYTYLRQPSGRMWKLLLASAIADGVWALGYLPNDLTWTIKEFFGPLGAAILVHLVLAFPNGHLRDRVDRWLVGIVYVIVLPIQLLAFATWDPAWVGCGPTDFCPRNLLLVVPIDPLNDVLSRIGYVAPVLAAIAIVEVIRHWRNATPVARRALAPVAFGMPIVFAIQGIWWLAPAIERDDIRIFLLQNKVFDLPSFLTPTLFLVGLVLNRLARAGLADLAVTLGRGVPLGGLRDAIATTLRDPSLELAFPAADGVGFVGPDGGPVALPEAGSHRSVARLEREDGELLAVLVHDPAVIDEDPTLLPAVSSVARMALENERLAAQVRAQLEEVRASRQRIVEAGDAERRRVERDLHDGAQQRLVALTMRLEAARASVDGASDLIDRTTAELRAAIREVRDLARGLHPTILAEAGLRAAVEALAERTPIPVEIDIPERRFEPATEAAAYFVIAEGLTNVVRYAAASAARVVVRADGERLVVRVEDDGRGGADPSAGSGLRGLLDRVAAIGGSLDVESPAGAGTTLIATLPVG